MKTLFLFPFLSIFIWANQNLSHSFPKKTIDTLGISHVQDGAIKEWPDSVFQLDKETNIKYAADNDGQNLYIAMNIPDFRTQMKMMRQGMYLYIDLKGKKREGRGIEFPVKRETEESGYSGGGSGNQQNRQEGDQSNRGFDKKRIRASYALHLLSLKLIGFTNGDPVEQGLQTDGSANINYSWDSTDVMYVEYLVPLKMLGDAASINQKTISLGWKINGVQRPSEGFSNSATEGSSSGGRGGGRGSGSRRSFGGSGSTGPTQADMDKMMQEQSFWTKYTFH